VRYLGISFVINPNINDMWGRLKERISGKLLKWNNMCLSLARRIQVCQKNFSSYTTYFSSAWLFNVNQIASIQKIIRDFLWSYGKGTFKTHVVEWEWCTKDRTWGGLGLKDLRIQGISLAVKWLAKATEGEEPWKVLIRHNLSRGHPCGEKF
jgi:hypothetical protein